MRWFSTISGLMATVAAVVTLATLSPEPEPPESAPPVLSVVDEYAERLAEESPDLAEFEFPAPHEVDLAKVDPAIAAALANGGYTDFVSANRLAVELPEDVLSALLANDAVLVIPSDDESQGESD